MWKESVKYYTFVVCPAIFGVLRTFELASTCRHRNISDTFKNYFIEFLGKFVCNK